MYITRRGKLVAVLLSEDEYRHLRQQGQKQSSFWEFIGEMWSDPAFDPVARSQEEIDFWRDVGRCRNSDGPGEVFARYQPTL